MSHAVVSGECWAIMSDENTTEAESNKQQSDSQRSSRFREIADRLDNETADGETGSNPTEETRTDSQADEASGAEKSSENTVEDIDVGLSRRTDQDDDSEDAAADSWEWIDDDNETTERPPNGEQSAAASSGTTSSSETTESSQQLGQQEGGPSPDQQRAQPDQPEAPDDPRDHLEEQDDSSVKANLSNETAADSTESPVTGNTEIESEKISAVDSITDTTSDTESGPDQTPSNKKNQDKTKGRIWDSQSPSSAQTDEPSLDSEFRTEMDAASTGTGEFTDTSTEYSSDGLPDHVELTPETTVLVQSGSQDDRTKKICQRLLYDDLDHPQPSVLLVRYQQMDIEELRQIAAEASQTKVISVGYAQDVPTPLEDAVETVNITNPNDITRLGIIISGTIDQWSKTDNNISFCYESLNVLLNYKDVKSTFRFLHVLLRKLRRGDAVAHFHADPLAGDPQSINTLKPLFDEIISIDSMGVTVE